ncbi:MFS transporter [Aetokthonos hydrillicola Thurmond2011]|jgi:HEAT repeat protein|uniref:MFS transporter n=1 Tax=Aetokthonos hydrillicola Thurmond2011 TaxID=2712845 RepID=A0AAP5IBG2_9CYAN|nr:MFS transporter [Aetokthonos hydrillicola]MBO3462013.1 MFS transporter [Aetokthonos hydrillicola CCALA 1050]MBW4584284.1 MFS transporter [Aetokthonos hydrillicola CCALA 1050]MDR9898507.1 MFS transporter [Aetokthonos hydrillicola Thurmond2011]
MELKKHWSTGNRGTLSRLLQWVNLRPEESDRTLLMFAFYTFTSIGLRWSEDSTVALFLDQYGAKFLPLIYIANAVIGALLVFLYSWLQKVLPLRQVIVAIAPAMFVPLVLLSWGTQVSQWTVITIFLLRLWVDAFYVVNDLNTSIVANQLFNIREIKRAYPLISSGMLLADIISGFSLPILVQFVGLNKVIMPISSVFIALGAIILWHLSNDYKQVFPNAPHKKISQVQHLQPRRQLLNPLLKHYALLLFVFFAFLQVLGVLIDFQYLTKLETNFNDKDIASFLGLFGGIAGVCELGMQWMISSRVLERFGVFVTITALPASVFILLALTTPLLGLFSTNQLQGLLWGLVILKFLDELLRYTFVASSRPLLFHPIPEKIRSYVQTLSGGVAEAIGAGIAGAVILVTLWFFRPFPNFLLLIETAILGLICTGIVWLIQTRYVNLLVLSAGQGKLNAKEVDLRAFKQAVIKTLGEKGNEAEQRSSIQMLAEIDPKGVGEFLAPLLIKLPPSLQQTSLEVMLTKGANPAYFPEVRTLLEQQQFTLTPEVFALAIRYIWLFEQNPDLGQLEKYLKQPQNSLIRATAAALLLRRGTPMQSSGAMQILRRMLTHKQERERVNAVKALTDAVYLQALRIHIPNLLQDESLRVRCAVLEMIGANHLEEYYSALIRGLYYKSTRMTAMGVLAGLENEILPRLTKLATNIYKPQVVRMYAWRTIGQIPTLEAIDTLWFNLESFRGTTRDHILRTLLQKRQYEEVTSLVDQLHSKVEALIKQEFYFLSEIYAAYTELQAENYQSGERFNIVCQLLQRALLEVEIDVKERFLLLLKLLYPQDKIQAAALNLRSQSGVNLARGLEILEHTVNLQSKSVLLNILDQRPPREKLQKLIEKGIAKYQPLRIGDRTRNLVKQRESLSDWGIACCFHFAQVAHIRLPSEQILATLRHPTGFVREAAISYLSVASPNVLQQLLPQLQNDPHPLIVRQVRELIGKC